MAILRIVFISKLYLAIRICTLYADMEIWEIFGKNHDRRRLSLHYNIFVSETWFSTISHIMANVLRFASQIHHTLYANLCSIRWDSPGFLHQRISTELRETLTQWGLSILPLAGTRYYLHCWQTQWRRIRHHKRSGPHLF